VNWPAADDSPTGHSSDAGRA